ncbi:hypothetical protein D9M72_507010 [compost metagenome]
MRGVDCAPALVDGHFVKQPLNRTTATPGEAVVDFLGLFGDMDMDRTTYRRCIEDRAHLLGRRRTQRMNGIAERVTGLAAERLEALQKRKETIRIMQEGPLPGIRRNAAEIGMRVENRQMGEADAGRAGGRENTQRHFCCVGIGRAISLMVQVVELGDVAETALQHLHIELGGDRLDIIRVHQPDGTVHFFPPGPEAVVAAAGDLGEARHGALEGVGMQVGDGGNQRTSDAFVAIGDRLIDLDGDDPA